MATLTARASARRTDHWFFAAMVLLVCVMVFVGFAPTYYRAGLVRASLPSPLVHVHAVLFSCWVLLLVAQVTLASAGQIRWHMRLGKAGMSIAALMVVIGFATLIAAVRRHSAPGMSTEALFASDTLQLGTFAGLVFFAFRFRANAAAHKRLILLASAALMGPALSRWTYAFLDTDLVFFLILDSFSIFLALYDLYSRRRIHPATLIGSLTILLMQYAMRPLAHAGWWRSITAWVER
jgi:hypothetical protein